MQGPLLFVENNVRVSANTQACEHNVKRNQMELKTIASDVVYVW